MSVLMKNEFVDFLQQHDQKQWNEVLKRLLPSIHIVDRVATRMWFGFWPLELTEALRDPVRPEEMARIMDLEGNWRLEEQIDTCVGFLYGARYWPQVKRGILSHTESSGEPHGTTIEGHIRGVAAWVAKEVSADESLLLGMTAVGFMILHQVGWETLAAVADGEPVREQHRRSPDQWIGQREKKSRGGLFGFLRGAGRRYRVVWDETRKGASFNALHGENIASAAAKDEWRYRSMDCRRPEGPIPVECRIGSCGYCWVGILSGNDNLSELSDYERKRLRYFGYDRTNDPGDPRPPIRLACQAECEGDVTLVVPPWNGELERRFDETRDKLGIA